MKNMGKIPPYAPSPDVLHQACINMSHRYRLFNGNCGMFAIALGEVLKDYGIEDLRFVIVDDFEGGGYAHVMLETPYGVFDGKGLWKDKKQIPSYWVKLWEKEEKTKQRAQLLYENFDEEMKECMYTETGWVREWTELKEALLELL